MNQRNNKLKSLIGKIFIFILFGLPISAFAADTKRFTGQIETPKKIYNIPGAVAVSTAKRHGYRFYSLSLTNRSNRASRYDKSCEFQGMHWATKSNKRCIVTGFSNNKPKCKSLRDGWILKNVKLKGNYVWTSRPDNTAAPKFRVKVTNNSSKTQVLLVDSINLEGPMGPANSWEDAFSHCSNPNYQN